MADLGDITRPDPAVLGELVYSVPGAKNVTKFKCGGFVLGLAINHCMFDGVGAMQFVNSWGETARGVPLSVPPALDRAVLRARDPPRVAFPHHEFAQIDDGDGGGSPAQDGAEPPLLHRSFRFTPESIARVKALAAGDGGGVGGRAPTTFEALAGAACAAGELSPARAVRLVRGAAEAVTDAYMRSAVDYFEATRARPSLASTLLITAWSRLPFRAADFGWGPPAAYGPAALPEREVALFLSCAGEGGGVRVLLGLPAAAMAEFERLVDEVIF
uniref:Uncharacterized protein n=1 Tax=Oryza barthii TaxID=65489 RepID=A0A0D3EY21_9ORYZ